jgi:CheY-like chemotaxis protein
MRSAHVFRAKGRVLIADDMPGIVQLLRDLLSEHGYEVQTAATGIDVLNIVPTFQPDVILLDMQMPGLTGMNVFDAVRRAGLKTPVIVISAHLPEAREGFFALLKKPFGLDSVADTVANAVTQRRQTCGLTPLGSLRPTERRKQSSRE